MLSIQNKRTLRAHNHFNHESVLVKVRRLKVMAPHEKSYLEVFQERVSGKKSHVSFPQLKYPSLRDGGFRDPVQWLTGKAMDDGAEGFWRIHDKIYDFTEFMDSHPGGYEWLELSKGTDITEAFECHHLTAIPKSYLQRYYLKDATTPRNSPFTFKEDGFFKTLKREVVEELKKIPKDVNKRADLIIDGLFATLLVCSSLACVTKGHWISTVFYLIAALALAWVVVAAHNYIHRRTNWRMYLFNLSLWSYRDFRVSHALSHHLYPNTLMDLEISAFEPIVHWLPRQKPLYAYLSFPIELIFFPFGFLTNFLKRFSSNLIRKGFFQKHYRWHDGVGFLLPIWMWISSGVSVYEALTMWLWILCTASFIFFCIGSNAAHHYPTLFKDGDEIEAEEIDWGLHELAAVMDRTDINGNLFKVMTFFGDHSLHHLFPTLDHAVLCYLYPVFLKNVEKFKAKFTMSNSLDLFIGQIKMAAKMTPNLLADEKKSL